MAEHEYQAAPLDDVERLSDFSETEDFLDATTIRAKFEFDPDFANSLAGVVRRAAEIVDDSRSKPADSRGVDPRVVRAYQKQMLEQNRLAREHTEAIRHATALGSAALRYAVAARQAQMARLGADIDTAAHTPARQSGTIGASVDHLAGAVVGSGFGAEEHQGLHRKKGPLTAVRILIVGGIPTATMTIGLLLLVGSLLNRPVEPNPYFALFTLLAGIALTATVVAGLRERNRE